MKEFKVLVFLDKFKKIFVSLGIDYTAMRRILQVKFTLDARRTTTIMMSSNGSEDSKKKERNNIIWSLWFYILLGIIFIPFIIAGNNFLFQMSVVFGIVMFMMTLTMISDFSSILLDLKDKDIILSKPVNSKTLNAAKIIHISVYIFLITISLTGPGLIAGFIKHGFKFSFIFFIEIILMDLLVIVITALLYLVVLRFFDGEKLKDIINYFQIIFTIIVTIGYQLVGRIFKFDELFNIQFTPKLWHCILPPIWFGGTFELIINNDRSRSILIFSILSFLVPIIAIVIYIRLVPVFENNLQKLNDASESIKPNNKGLNYYISKIVCKTKNERIFFRFASSMIKNEREFKLRVYPSLGISLILPFISMIYGLRDGGLSQLRDTKIFFAIYFIAMDLPSIVMNLGCSGNYKGAWIYNVVPMNGLSDVFKGAIKACIINLVLPVYILASIASIFIFKGKIFIDLIIIFLGILLFAVICFKMLNKVLPFSKPFEDAGKSSVLITFIIILLLGVLALFHYTATTIHYGRFVYMIVLTIINLIVWKKAFNVDVNSLY